MSNAFQTYKLGEIANVIRGVTFGRSDGHSTPTKNHLPVLRAGNIQNRLILEKDLVWVPQSKIRKNQLIKQNDIIMCTSSGSPAIVGKCAISEKDWGGSFGAFCIGIRPQKSKCIPSYLLHYLHSPIFTNWSKKSSGVNIKNIRKSELEDFSIPLPPLPEQKRIAAILDKADAIRRKRQAAIKLADDFLRATFLDMFGNPVTNPKGWDIASLNKFGNVTTGNTPSRKHAEFYGNNIEWIKSDNINTPNHFLTTAVEGLSEEGKKVARIVPSNSTLVTCIAGSLDCIGNAALTNREVAFNQQINAITPNINTDPYFLYALIINTKKIIQNASTNSMKGMVSKGNFEKIKFFKPPISLQRKFGLFFSKHIKQNNKIYTSEILLSNFFNSLTQHAFRGKL